MIKVSLQAIIFTPILFLSACQAWGRFWDDDSVKIPNVLVFAATPGDTQVFLSWTNPSNADFAGIKILRKQGGYSGSPSDGLVIYTGAATAFTDSGLLNGTEYFYSAFAYNANQEFSETVERKIAIPIKGSWYTFFGGSGIQAARSVVQTTDGGYIVSGYASGAISSLDGKPPLLSYTANSDFLVIKLTAVGTVSWYTFLGASGNDPGGPVGQTADGGYILFGRSDNAIPSLGGQSPLNARNALDDFLVIKLTSVGAVSWYTFLGGSGWETANSIAQTSDGGYILTGGSGANIPSLGGQSPLNAYTAAYDFLTIKLTPDGTVSWYTFVGSSAGDDCKAVLQTPDGGYMLLGNAGADIPSLAGKTPLNAYTAGTELLAVKLTATGSISWYSFFGGTGADQGLALAQSPDGGYFLLGVAGANIANLGGQVPLNAYNTGDDLLAIKLNPEGTVSWYTFVGGAGTDQGNAIAETTDGGVILLGTAGANIPSISGKSPLNAFSAGSDFIAVKLSASGAVNWYTFIGGAGNEMGYSVKQTTDGGYIFAGAATANIGSLGGQAPLFPYGASDDYLIVKVKANGGF